MAFYRVLFLLLLIFIPYGGARADLRYVAMGASDAVGIGATPITDGYAFQIEAALDSCGQAADLEIVAVPGAQMSLVKNLEVPLTIFRDPDLITLWPGPNDLVRGRSAKSFQSLLRDVLSDLTQATSAFVVLADLPDLTQLPRYKGKHNRKVTRARIASFNRVIKRESAASGIPVVSLARHPVTPDLVSDRDGFHPNDAGYHAIADAFLSIILPRYCAGT